VQLADVIAPEALFRNYIYVTGTSETMAVHNRAYADTVALVRKRRPDRARRAALVAVVEVIDEVVVEVHRLLHETQTEGVDAEIEIGLCIIDRRRDVMQPENRRAHTLK